MLWTAAKGEVDCLQLMLTHSAVATDVAPAAVNHPTRDNAQPTINQLIWYIDASYF